MNLEKLSSSQTITEILNPSDVGLRKDQVVEEIKMIHFFLHMKPSKHHYKGKLIDIYV